MASYRMIAVAVRSKGQKQVQCSLSVVCHTFTVYCVVCGAVGGLSPVDRCIRSNARSSFTLYNYEGGFISTKPVYEAFVCTTYSYVVPRTKI